MRKFIPLLLSIAIPCAAADGRCPAKWGYGPNDGPAQWGSLDPAWRICSTGLQQSPLDVKNFDARRDDLPPLTFPGNARFYVENSGHDLEIRMPAGERDLWKLVRRGLPTLTLERFHFHVPAEHYDKGKQHAGEVHFVFNDGARAVVVAVWITPGAANPALTKILALKPPNKCTHSPTSRDPISMADFRLVNPDHYATYNGSLTTPPCSENVTFIILLDPITASPEQIKMLQLIPNNARPLQWMKYR